MRRTSKKFAQLKDAVLAEGQGEEAPSAKDTSRRNTNTLDLRFEAAAVVSGKLRNVQHIFVSPASVRPWAGHNRDYAALNEQRCADLIDGFRRTGQEFPAIVRRVEDSSEYDYEFICGARRHWSATYLKRDLLIEVRELDDKQAFLLQDIENRDREDISDYERACDYAKALPIHFGGVAKVMANELQIDPGNFARYLAMADLPQAIVEAYSDVRELLTHHSSNYAKWMKDGAAKKRMLAAATKLKGQGATGKEVMKALKAAAEGSGTGVMPVKKSMRTIGAFTLKQGRGGRLSGSFELPTSAGAVEIEALRRDFEKVIAELAEEEA